MPRSLVIVATWWGLLVLLRRLYISSLGFGNFQTEGKYLQEVGIQLRTLETAFRKVELESHTAGDAAAGIRHIPVEEDSRDCALLDAGEAGSDPGLGCSSRC